MVLRELANLAELQRPCHPEGLQCPGSPSQKTGAWLSGSCWSITQTQSRIQQICLKSILSLPLGSSYGNKCSKFGFSCVLTLSSPKLCRSWTENKQDRLLVELWICETTCHCKVNGGSLMSQNLTFPFPSYCWRNGPQKCDLSIIQWFTDYPNCTTPIKKMHSTTHRVKDYVFWSKWKLWVLKWDRSSDMSPDNLQKNEM